MPDFSEPTSTLGKGKGALRRDKTGKCSGSPELAIVVSRRSYRETSLWKAGDRHKERKEGQKRRPVGTVGGNLLAVPTPLMHCSLPRMPVRGNFISD
jgi:hypothetical protein